MINEHCMNGNIWPRWNCCGSVRDILICTQYKVPAFGGSIWLRHPYSFIILVWFNNSVTNHIPIIKYIRHPGLYPRQHVYASAVSWTVLSGSTVREPPKMVLACVDFLRGPIYAELWRNSLCIHSDRVGSFGHHWTLLWIGAFWTIPRLGVDVVFLVVVMRVVLTSQTVARVTLVRGMSDVRS